MHLEIGDEDPGHIQVGIQNAHRVRARGIDPMGDGEVLRLNHVGNNHGQSCQTLADDGIGFHAVF